MSYLTTKLKLISIETLSYNYYIVAKTRSQAEKYFLSKLNEEELEKDELGIYEMQQSDNWTRAILNEKEDKLLLELINEGTDKIDNNFDILDINVLDLLKYKLLTYQIQGKEIKLPKLLHKDEI